MSPGQTVARVGDAFTTPLATPGSPSVPHVGGPILGGGELSVLVTVVGGSSRVIVG